MTNKSMLGYIVKDIVTGFQGTVTGVVSYLTGCDQFLIQPKIKSGNEFIEARWFDENRIKRVGSKTKLKISDRAESGELDNDLGVDNPPKNRIGIGGRVKHGPDMKAPIK